MVDKRELVNQNEDIKSRFVLYWTTVLYQIIAKVRSCQRNDFFYIS